jgi:hypothetical protein
MLADVSEGAGAEAVRQINAAGGRAQFALVDVSNSEQVKHLVERTLKEFGDLHILFNGAGILTYGTVVETSEEAWQRIIAVNLTGTFLCSKAVLPHMMAKGRGAIVNVSSTTGSHDACAHAAAYVSSKGGVTLLTRSMAIDFARYGIRVTGTTGCFRQNVSHGTFGQTGGTCRGRAVPGLGGCFVRNRGAAARGRRPDGRSVRDLQQYGGIYGFRKRSSESGRARGAGRRELADCGGGYRARLCFAFEPGRTHEAGD